MKFGDGPAAVIEDEHRKMPLSDVSMEAFEKPSILAQLYKDKSLTTGIYISMPKIKIWAGRRHKSSGEGLHKPRDGKARQVG